MADEKNKTDPEIKMEMVSVKSLVLSKNNVRGKCDFGNDPEMKSLIESIREKGMLVPLTVRPLQMGAGFEIAAGHRRYEAAKVVKLERVPCMIRTMDDQEFLEVMITDNLQRKDIHPMDEASGYAKLRKMQGWDIGEIAARVGKTEDYVARRMKLTDLIPKAIKVFMEGRMLLGHAEALCRQTSEDQQNEMKNQFWRSSKEMPTVTAYEKHLSESYMLELGKATFSKTDSKLLGKKGQACVSCPMRTGCVQSLFPDIKSKDICTDAKCYAKKMRAHVDEAVKAGRVPLSNTEGYQLKYSTLGRPLGRYPGALLISHWFESGAKKRWENSEVPKCDKAIPSVISDGDRMGELIDVCSDRSCKVHFKKKAKSDRPKNMNLPENRENVPTYEHRQKAETEMTLNRIKKVATDLEKSKAKFGPQEILEITLTLIENQLDHEQVNALVMHAGLKCPQDGFFGETELNRHVGEMADVEVKKLLMIIVKIDSMPRFKHDDIAKVAKKVMVREKAKTEKEKSGYGADVK